MIHRNKSDEIKQKGRVCREVRISQIRCLCPCVGGVIIEE